LKGKVFQPIPNKNIKKMKEKDFSEMAKLKESTSSTPAPQDMSVVAHQVGYQW
jgi:hypothetical protein